MQGKFNERDNLFLDAALLVVEKQEATIDLLKKELNINEKRAETIMSELESEGVVSELLDNNTRDVEMNYEEFSLIFNYKKPMGSSVKAASVKSNTMGHNNNIDQAYKKSLPMWMRIISSILIIFLIYLFTRRFSFFTSLEPEITISDTVSGWVKDGRNWNYYDINGNKLIKSIIDDGGIYYYFDDNGNLAVERWIDYNGRTFYANKDGVILKNQWVGDYYVGNDGSVLKNTTTPDGYKVGSDGRYIAETKPVVPQTIVIRETVPIMVTPTEATTIDPNYLSYSVPSDNPKNIINSEYGTNIDEPTAGYQEVSNVINNVNSVKNGKQYNLTIQSVENYKEKTYLSNDRACSINLLIPKLVDKDGNECIPFMEEMLKAQDNIISELIDLADYAIEDDEDGYGYFSTKYISSISFNEARISTQDDYSLVIREIGKCNWNKGKDTKIRLIIDYDKATESLSYYIEE